MGNHLEYGITRRLDTPINVGQKLPHLPSEQYPLTSLPPTNPKQQPLVNQSRSSLIKANQAQSRPIKAGFESGKRTCSGRETAKESRHRLVNANQATPTAYGFLHLNGRRVTAEWVSGEITSISLSQPPRSEDQTPSDKGQSSPIKAGQGQSRQALSLANAGATVGSSKYHLADVTNRLLIPYHY